MSIRLRYYYVSRMSVNGQHASLSAARQINNYPHGHHFYRLGVTDTDFPAHHPEYADDVLLDIEKIERGEIKYAQWDGQGFEHRITATQVEFEHAIFNECPEWPIWRCTLAQYKAALQGWRTFIDMPVSIDSELIVELPDSPAGFEHFKKSESSA